MLKRLPKDAAVAMGVPFPPVGNATGVPWEGHAPTMGGPTMVETWPGHGFADM